MKCQLDESQVGIKIVRRNINNLRYADDNTLMAESKQEIASWWGWKRRVKKLAWNTTLSPITSWQIEGEKVETVTNFLFLGSKITVNCDCSHEIKRHLLLGRNAITNLDSVLKSRTNSLPTKVHIVKAMVFPIVMYGSETWTVKKAEHQRINAF